MLPQNSQLGHLSIVEVYEYFDMPTLYCAKNTLGTYYVVYWCDEDNGKEGWLYLPISQRKLNELRRGLISFNQAYSNPETGYYLAYVSAEQEGDDVRFYSYGELDDDFLPPSEFYVRSIVVADSPEEDWAYRVLVKNSNSRDHRVQTDESASALALVRDLIVSLMSSLSGNNRWTPVTYALGADYGSFDARIGTNNNELAFRALALVNRITNSDSRNAESLFVENNIDPYKFENIYSYIIENKLDISIIPKFCYGVAAETVFENATAKEHIDRIKESHHASLPSIKVPQANNIDTVIQLVNYIGNGVSISHELFGNLNSERQVKYYKDAAYALGLLDRNHALTSEGRFFLSKNTKKAQYQVLANLFELSDFGWNWMKRYQKQSMKDLEPNTAEEFVRESVPTLSVDTARRRSTTLSKWLTDLKPYHIEYDVNEE